METTDLRGKTTDSATTLLTGCFNRLLHPPDKQTRQSQKTNKNTKINFTNISKILTPGNNKTKELKKTK